MSDDLVVVEVEPQRSGGRRWQPLYYLEPLASPADGLDALPVVDGMHLQRDREYRLVWVEAKGLWRLDWRRFVPGG